MKYVIGLVLAVFATMPVIAQEVMLFKDFAFGSKVSEFSENKGFYDCSEEIGSRAQCKEDIKFLDHDFFQVLIFIEGRLRFVRLATEFEATLFQRTINAMVSQKFVLVGLQNGVERLDVLELLHRGKGDVDSKVQEFESIGLNGNGLTYMFMEAPATALQRSRNLGELLRHMPENSREVDVEVATEDGVTYLRIDFTAPKRAIKEFQNAPIKVEKF